MLNYCIFEYRYRDAGNFKVYGKLLLKGKFTQKDQEAIENKCDTWNFFIAEQLKIPTLYEELYQFSDGPTEEDVPAHEFVGLRHATKEEIGTLKLWGNLKALRLLFEKVQTWDYMLSPHA